MKQHDLSGAMLLTGLPQQDSCILRRRSFDFVHWAQVHHYPKARRAMAPPLPGAYTPCYCGVLPGGPLAARYASCRFAAMLELDGCNCDDAHLHARYNQLINRCPLRGQSLRPLVAV